MRVFLDAVQVPMFLSEISTILAETRTSQENSRGYLVGDNRIGNFSFLARTAKLFTLRLWNLYEAYWFRKWIIKIFMTRSSCNLLNRTRLVTRFGSLLKLEILNTISSWYQWYQWKLIWGVLIPKMKYSNIYDALFLQPPEPNSSRYEIWIAIKIGKYSTPSRHGTNGTNGTNGNLYEAYWFRKRNIKIFMTRSSCNLLNRTRLVTRFGSLLKLEYLTPSHHGTNGNLSRRRIVIASNAIISRS